MTTYLRLRPNETREEFIKRVAGSAPRPNPDQLARLVALLRSGDPQRSRGSRRPAAPLQVGGAADG